MFSRVSPTHRSRALRSRVKLDPMAAAWGGLIGAIGLMIGSGRDWPARLVITGLAFGLGGFLAGVRAIGRRPSHGAIAWIGAYALHAAFIAFVNLIDLFGGPPAPHLFAGGPKAWILAALWALAAALVGAALAHRWLTPPLHHY